MNNNYEDDNDYDENGILKDGRTVSVKTWMMDSLRSSPTSNCSIQNASDRRFW